MKAVTRYGALLLLLTLLITSPALAGADDDATAKKGITPPAEWIVPSARPLRVHAIHGVWHQYQGIERALARLGGAHLSESWHSLGGLRYYPGSYEWLMGQHLIVAGNINAGSIGAEGRKRLKDYVERGGALLLLGGKYAFGPEYRGTALEEIAPVTFADKFDQVNAKDGLLLSPGKDAIGKGWGNLPWTAQPRVYWYHTMTPKAEAKVLLTAGGQPLLIVGTYGKGRVAIFAGSVMGDPAPGQTPCWMWAGWPDVLADTIGWMTESPRTAPAGFSATAKERFTAKFLGRGEKKVSVLAPVLGQYAGLCADTATANLLLEGTANLEGDVPIDTIDEVADGVRPYLHGAADMVERLLVENTANKLSLALRVIGGSNTDGARETLESALVDGDVKMDNDGGDMLDDVKIDEDPDYRAYAVRLGALEGLGNLGDKASIPAIRAVMAKYARNTTWSSTNPALTPENELYQEAAVAALRCGDADAADAAVTAILSLRYLFIEMQVALDRPVYEKETEGQILAKQRMARQRFRAIARERQLARKLSTVPAAILPAVARRVTAEEDVNITSIAFTLFGKAYHPAGWQLPKEAADILKTSKIPAVAELANQR